MKTILPKKTMSWCCFVNILTKGLLLGSTYARELIKKLLSSDKNHFYESVLSADARGLKLPLYNVSRHTIGINRLTENHNIIGV